MRVPEGLAKYVTEIPLLNVPPFTTAANAGGVTGVRSLLTCGEKQDLLDRLASPHRSIQGVTTLMEPLSVVHAIRNGERGVGRTVNHPTSSTSTRVTAPSRATTSTCAACAGCT